MSLRMLLLIELADSPKSGYDLANASIEWNNVWKASSGQIYTELRKMENEGLVVASEPGARGRRAYRVTGEGRSAVVDWLTNTPTDHDQRNETIVRAFGLGLLPAEQALDWLNEEIRYHQTRYKKLSEDVAAIDPVAEPHRRGEIIGGKAGVFRTQAAVEWAMWAHETIRKWAEEDER